MPKDKIIIDRCNYYGVNRTSLVIIIGTYSTHKLTIGIIAVLHQLSFQTLVLTYSEKLQTTTPDYRLIFEKILFPLPYARYYDILNRTIAPL